jgi:CheY-like chemotaxis protein
VDDTTSNRKMLEMVLKKRQIGCDMAENGQLAVDMVAAKGDEYDFIFMDFTMPGTVVR